VAQHEPLLAQQSEPPSAQQALPLLQQPILPEAVIAFEPRVVAGAATQNVALPVVTKLPDTFADLAQQSLPTTQQAALGAQQEAPSAA